MSPELQVRQDIYAEFNPQPHGWNLRLKPSPPPQQCYNKRPSAPRRFTAEELFLINLKRLASQRKGDPT